LAGFELQWGRSIGSCGNQSPGRRRRLWVLASMGPQHW